MNRSTKRLKKKATIEVETFDDGTEEQFLIFKRNLLQTVSDNDLEPSNVGHGAKHLYKLMRLALSGNVLDKWINISSARAIKITKFFSPMCGS